MESFFRSVLNGSLGLCFEVWLCILFDYINNDKKVVDREICDCYLLSSEVIWNRQVINVELLCVQFFAVINELNFYMRL